jgi:hypothetical protein
MALELTDRIDVFTLATVALLEANKSVLGLTDVWLGDQVRVPRTPCAAVEPGPKTREYNGAPRRFSVDLESYIMLYMEKVQDTQLSTQEVMSLAEEVEAVLHADAQMGGLVTSSYVLQNDPGYAERSGTLYRASRLTFRATSQKQLPFSISP